MPEALDDVRPFARGLKGVPVQQPDGDAGDTPGVAAAPVALAGAIVPGVARFIVMLSAQADVFGVGITAIVGSMLVAPSCVMSGWIVPGGGLPELAGVESGKAAPLVGGPPGVELHTVVDGCRAGTLAIWSRSCCRRSAWEWSPTAVDDIVVVDGIDVVDGVIEAVLPAMDVETVLGIVDGVGTGGSSGRRRRS